MLGGPEVVRVVLNSSSSTVAIEALVLGGPEVVRARGSTRSQQQHGRFAFTRCLAHEARETLAAARLHAAEAAAFTWRAARMKTLGTKLARRWQPRGYTQQKQPAR